MENKITSFYYEQICNKYNHRQINTNLKNVFPEQHESIKPIQSIVLDYTCDCVNCIESNILINPIDNSDRIKQNQYKNKLYLCETRTNVICDYLFQQINLNNQNIILIVPSEYTTLNKIMNLIVKTSDNKFVKKKILWNTKIPKYFYYPHYILSKDLWKIYKILV